MGLERWRANRKERVPVGAIVLRPQEQEPFRAAVSKFTGQEHYSISATFGSEKLVLPQQIKFEKDTVHIQPVKLSPNGDEQVLHNFKTNNQLFNILLETSISQKSRESILQYLHQTDQEGEPLHQILMLRYEEPSNAFQKELRAHTSNHHRNLAPVTEILLSKSMLPNKKRRNQQPPFELDEEQRSLLKLQTYANESIRFVAITPTASTKLVPNYIKQALDKMNKAADPYEFVYDIFATLAKQQKKQGKFSAGLIAVGAGSGFIFGPMASAIGQTPTDVISQAAGEGVGMIQAGSDRIITTLQRRKHQEETNQVEHIHEKSSKKPLLTRGIVFLSNVAVATGASYLSLKTGDPTWLAPVAPINTTAIDTVELYERAFHGRELGANPKYQQLVERYALQESGPIARRVLRNHPHMALSLVDFKKYNPAATATLVGTGISAGTLTTAIHLYPHMPRAWILALSGLIIENAFGVYGSMIGVHKDPWKEFTNTVNDLEKIEGK